MIPLEKGLAYYYEQQREFEHRELPVEKQVAIAYEAGFYAGRNMVKEQDGRKRYDLMWVPEE